MWIQSVHNAISEVEMKFPGLVETVSEFDADSELTPKQWEQYNQVAGAIVEPFVFPGCESDDEEFYYERTERDGYGMVKGNLAGIPNRDEWLKVIDLIEELGY